MARGIAFVFVSYVLIILTGLAIGKEKELKKSKSGSLVIDNSRPHSVNRTDSDIIGIIKFEETFSDTLPPAGWQVIDGDGSGLTWEYVEGIDFTNGDSVRPQAGAAFWSNSYESANEFIIADWLLTPRLPALEAGDSLYVYVNALGLLYPDTVSVWISVSDSSLQSFDTAIGMIIDPGPVGEWHLYALDITLDSALVGMEVFVGFKHDHQDGGLTGSGSDWVFFDHVILANGGLTGIGNNAAIQPSDFVLKQNYPNPFNPTTTIAYDLNKSADVTLKVYNLAGQEVKMLINEKQSAGSKQVTWNGRNNSGHQVASGIYLYRLEVGSVVQTKKMVLLK